MVIKKRKTYIFCFIAVLIFIVGCTQQNVQKSGEPAVNEILADTEWTGEIYFKGEEINFKGKIVWEDKVTFTMIHSEKNNNLHGSGKGQMTMTESGECTGETIWNYEIEVGGNYQRSKERFIWSVGPVNTDWVFKPNCVGRTGKAYVGSRVASPKIPTWLSDIQLELYDGEIIEKTFERGDESSYYKMVLQSSSKLTSLKGFDFDVDVDPPIITIKQGETAKATVSVKLLRGNPQPLKMTVTDWSSQNINAWFDKSSLNPGESTILNIRTSCNTPSDEYLHTAQGEIGFRSSVDAVNVKVTNDPNCGS